MRQSGLTLLLITLLVVSAALPIGVLAQTEEQQCSSVVHDSFRVSNTTLQELNETGTATATQSNVAVTLEETETFVRLRASNPNGYCVQLEVEISEQVVDAAELGSVDAAEPADSDVTAQWSAKHDLAADETYTSVEVSLPAGAEVLFAPSKLRVRTLSWTGEAEVKANSTLGELRSLLGMSDPLQQHTYALEGEAGDVLTVSLESGDGSEEVERWHALYKTADGWKPVGTDSSAPVFYTEQSGDKTVKFHYNSNQTTVEFTANPGIRDRLRYETQSYLSSIRDAISIELPFQVSSL